MDGNRDAGRLLPRDSRTDGGLETCRAATYHLLGVIRVVTEVPGGPADRTRSFTLPIGRTVLALGGENLRDDNHFVKSRRIEGGGFDGQSDERGHGLRAGDSVEVPRSLALWFFGARLPGQ